VQFLRWGIAQWYLHSVATWGHERIIITKQENSPMKATPSGIPDAQWDALIELEAAVIAAARLCVARHDVYAATDLDQDFALAQGSFRELLHAAQEHTAYETAMHLVQEAKQK